MFEEKFENFFHLTEMLQVVPFATAIVERAFLLRKQVKSDWSINLSTSTGDLMSMFLESPSEEQHSVERAVKMWDCGGNQRRLLNVQPFGKRKCKAEDEVPPKKRKEIHCESRLMRHPWLFSFASFSPPDMFVSTVFDGISKHFERAVKMWDCGGKQRRRCNVQPFGKRKMRCPPKREKRSIVNHVYWRAASTSDGDGEVMVAKYRSVTNHGEMWRVLSQNGLTPFWSIWDILDLSCWNIKKIRRKFVLLLTISSKIFLYIIMSKVSLESHYFVSHNDVLTLKRSKMVFNPFCDKTLHVHTGHDILFPHCEHHAHYPEREGWENVHLSMGLGQLLWHTRTEKLCFSFSQVTFINNDFSLKSITHYVRSFLASWYMKITHVEVCDNVI